MHKLIRSVKTKSPGEASWSHPKPMLGPEGESSTFPMEGQNLPYREEKKKGGKETLERDDPQDGQGDQARLAP